MNELLSGWPWIWAQANWLCALENPVRIVLLDDMLGSSCWFADMGNVAGQGEGRCRASSFFSSARRKYFSRKGKQASHQAKTREYGGYLFIGES